MSQVINTTEQPILLYDLYHRMHSQFLCIDVNCGEIDKLIYVSIPKNASTWVGENYFHNKNNTENFKYHDIENIVKIYRCKFIVILRDPLDRWISGMTQMIYTEPEQHFGYILGRPGVLTKRVAMINPMYIDTFDWETVIATVAYDNHTQKQIHFTRVIPFANIVWLKFDDNLKENFIDLMSSYGIQLTKNAGNTDNAANITKNNDVKTLVMKKIVNALDQHPEYSQKIIEYYHEDYALINLVKFYKKQ